MVKRGKFNVPVDRAAVYDEWHRRGNSCGLFVDPPSRQWNDFVHDTNDKYVVTRVTSRRSQVTSRGKTYLNMGKIA